MNSNYWEEKGSKSTEQILSAGIVSTLVLLSYRQWVKSQREGVGINPF